MFDRHTPRGRWARIVAGGVALGLIGVAVGNLLFPAPTLPPLLRDLPSEYAKAGPKLTARLRTRFPDGSDEAALIRALADQGFQVSPPAHEASWKRDELGCVEIARIWWRAERGRVIAIEGLRNAICP